MNKTKGSTKQWRKQEWEGETDTKNEQKQQQQQQKYDKNTKEIEKFSKQFRIMRVLHLDDSIFLQNNLKEWR